MVYSKIKGHLQSPERPVWLIRTKADAPLSGEVGLWSSSSFLVFSFWCLQIKKPCRQLLFEQEKRENISGGKVIEICLHHQQQFVIL